MVQSHKALKPGDHIIRVVFDYAGGGIGKSAKVRLLVDEKEVAHGVVEHTSAVRFSLDETFDIGEDTGTPVIEDYREKMPFRFTGTLKRFAVVLKPQALPKKEQQRLQEALGRALMAAH